MALPLIRLERSMICPSFHDYLSLHLVYLLYYIDVMMIKMNDREVIYITYCTCQQGGRIYPYSCRSGSSIGDSSYWWPYWMSSRSTTPHRSGSQPKASKTHERPEAYGKLPPSWQRSPPLAHCWQYCEDGSGLQCCWWDCSGLSLRCWSFQSNYMG